MQHIDCFVAAVPNKNKQKYIEHSRQIGQFFRKHGALEYIECWGTEVPQGKKTSFPMAVQCQQDETVVIGWVIWSGKQERDEGMHASMAEYRQHCDAIPMPFDAGRLIFGTFEKIIDMHDT